MKFTIKKALVSFGVAAGIIALAGGNAAASTFVPGHIIDDYIFNNSTSMNANQINAFLNTFPSSCISPNNGFLAPDLTGYSPSAGFTYGGNATAGIIISHAAQAYGINPQVLLSTMQKEQSLVSGGGGCSTLAYTAAMGYGCPDSGGQYSYSGTNLYTLNGNTVTSVSGTCVNTVQKAGFSQQVIHAAWLLEYSENRSEGNVNFDVQLNTTKDYTGNAWVSSWSNSDDPQSCYSGPMTQGTFSTCPNQTPVYYDGYYTIDGTSTYISTGSTAALYWYTPHFSGNENFFNIFTGWFGPTTTSGFNWQYVSQNAYTDQTEATQANLMNVIPGQRYYLTVSAKNVGTQTWTQGIVNLATDNPGNRSSEFYDSTWDTPDRPATLGQSSVAPGQTGTFSFWVTIPNWPGDHKEYFDPVADGYSWMNELGLYWEFNVQPEKYTWQYVSQNAYTDQTMATPADLSNAVPGQRYYLTLTATNTGNEPWLTGQANLGTDMPINSGSPFYDSTWFTADRAATVSSEVLPGQNATWSFWVKIPDGLHEGGTYKAYFDPVIDGVTWMTDYGVYWQFTLPDADYSWQYVSQNAYTDQTMATPVNTNSVTPGQRMYASLQIKNTGNAVWYPGKLNLGTSQPINRTSKFYDSSWISTDRPATISSITLPGQTATINFWVTAPTAAGTYKEYFDPVQEWITWLTDYGLYWQFTVT